jgi:hypothetical protein
MPAVDMCYTIAATSHTHLYHCITHTHTTPYTHYYCCYYRIADDGGVPDLDFPELDAAAAIIDVGVDEFVLCEQGRVTPLLIIRVLVEGSSSSNGASSSSSLVLEVRYVLLLVYCYHIVFILFTV